MSKIFHFLQSEKFSESTLYFSGGKVSWNLFENTIYLTFWIFFSFSNNFSINLNNFQDIFKQLVVNFANILNDFCDNSNRSFVYILVARLFVNLKISKLCSITYGRRDAYKNDNCYEKQQILAALTYVGQVLDLFQFSTK